LVRAIHVFFQELLDVYKRFVVLTAGDDNFKPKSHLMVHVTVRASYQGNPWWYQCFLDESLNKVLKGVLSTASQQTFEAVAYFKLQHVLESSAKRARNS